MQRQQYTLTLSVPPDTKDQLADLARKHECFWGDKPSPSKFVAAIASGALPVGTPAGLDGEQTRALVDAIQALETTGEARSAQILLALTKAQGSFEGQDAAAVYDKLETAVSPWREVLEQAKAQKQPVMIFYSSGRRDESTRYTAQTWEVFSRNNHWYVDIYAEEAAANSNDLEPLTRNRRLRIDRIKKVIPTLHPVVWREEGLPSILAHLKVIGADAKHYVSHPDDDRVGELEEDASGSAVRQVWRHNYTTWWFVKDILYQGQNVVVLGPEELVDEVARSAKAIASHYSDRPKA